MALELMEHGTNSVNEDDKNSIASRRSLGASIHDLAIWRLNVILPVMIHRVKTKPMK